MAYFKINGVDYSMYVNKLNVRKSAVYNSQTNAAGDTVCDYINSKRTIEVGIIPLKDSDMSKLLTAVDGFNMAISYRNPITNELAENVNCIITDTEIEYYTIQVNNVMYNELTLTFEEL